MEEFGKLLTKLIGSLPFKKLTANQTFDLCFDLIMVGIIFLEVKSDLGPHEDVLKPLTLLLGTLLIFWSLVMNKEFPS